MSEELEDETGVFRFTFKKSNRRGVLLIKNGKYKFFALLLKRHLPCEIITPSGIKLDIITFHDLNKHV